MSAGTIKEELHLLVDQLDDDDAVEVVRYVRRFVAENGELAADETVVQDDEGITWGKPFTFDDPLWNIAGLIDDDGPTDVSENKYKYLAEAYSDNHEE